MADPDAPQRIAEVQLPAVGRGMRSVPELPPALPTGCGRVPTSTGSTPEAETQKRMRSKLLGVVGGSQETGTSANPGSEVVSIVPMVRLRIGPGGSLPGATPSLPTTSTIRYGAISSNPSIPSASSRNPIASRVLPWKFSTGIRSETNLSARVIPAAEVSD